MNVIGYRWRTGIIVRLVVSAGVCAEQDYGRVMHMKKTTLAGANALMAIRLRSGFALVVAALLLSLLQHNARPLTESFASPGAMNITVGFSWDHHVEAQSNNLLNLVPCTCSGQRV